MTNSSGSVQMNFPPAKKYIHYSSHALSCKATSGTIVQVDQILAYVTGALILRVQHNGDIGQFFHEIIQLQNLTQGYSI